MSFKRSYKNLVDQKRRLDFHKNENSKNLNKFMYVSILNSTAKILKQNNAKKIYVARFLHSNIKKGVSKTKTVRRCVLTGRARVNYSKYFRVSRVKIREIIETGAFPGISKACW